MKVTRWIARLLGLSAFAAGHLTGISASDTGTSAPTVKSPSNSAAPSFDSFRFIADHNIFDPNRVSRSARATRSEVTVPPQDVIHFVGTMEYEKGYFAFFDSPNRKYRGVLKSGEKIADFTVKRVLPAGVELAQGDRRIALQVTQQIARTEGSEWTVSAFSPPAEAANPSAPEAISSGSSSPPALPAEASDTLKRLMEQRQKQLKE